MLNTAIYNRFQPRRLRRAVVFARPSPSSPLVCKAGRQAPAGSGRQRRRDMFGLLKVEATAGRRPFSAPRSRFRSVIKRLLKQRRLSGGTKGSLPRAAFMLSWIIVFFHPRHLATPHETICYVLDSIHFKRLARAALAASPDQPPPSVYHQENDGQLSNSEEILP